METNRRETTLPILSEWDLKTPEEQKALARQAATILAGAARAIFDDQLTKKEVK